MFLNSVFVNDVNDVFVKCIVVGPDHKKKDHKIFETTLTLGLLLIDVTNCEETNISLSSLWSGGNVLWCSLLIFSTFFFY